MKPIKAMKLKIGDWFRTQPIFSRINERNELVGIYSLCYVKKVKGNKKGGNDIYVASWTIDGDKMYKGGLPFKMDKVFLLNKKEMGEFNKKLILLNL